MEDSMEVFLKLKLELPPLLKQTYIFAQSKALKQSHAIIHSFSKHFWGVFTEKNTYNLKVESYILFGENF